MSPSSISIISVQGKHSALLLEEGSWLRWTSPGEVHASEVVLGPLLKCGFNPESRIPSGAEWEAVAKTTSTPAERQHEMGTRALRLTALHPCCQFLHCMCSSGIQECHSDASAPAGGIWGSSDLR